MTRFKKGKIEICLFYYSMKTRSIGCHLCSLNTLILTSDLQLVPIYRCDLLLSFPNSHTYHKEVHRRGRLFSTERYLRFFHIWARFVSICLANSSCTNCNGKYILMIIYQQYAPFFPLKELQYMADMYFDKLYVLFLS